MDTENERYPFHIASYVVVSVFMVFRGSFFHIGV